MYHLTNGLDGLDVGFFLHENKVLFSNRDNDVVRVLVRRLKKRLSWESSSTPMHSSPTLPSCTSQPDSQVSLAPRTTCGSRGASKKKCGFMVCCRECIPVWWGALVKIGTQILRSRSWPCSESINKSNPREALSSPPGHSATENIPSTFPLVRILTPSHFTHRDFRFLFVTTSSKKRNPDPIQSHGVLDDRPAMRRSLPAHRAAPPTLPRRRLLPLLLASPALAKTLPAFAEGDSHRVFVRGRITVEGGEPTSSSSALYITARPAKAADVPRAILDGSNGKPPPCLAARIPLTSDSFPYEFSLTDLDLTPEGASSAESGRWFDGIDLVVSARYDTDGVAATRDPTDLVGRAIARRDPIVIQLKGRGFGGKLVTSKGSSSKP